jgi:hypothetical protein
MKEVIHRPLPGYGLFTNNSWISIHRAFMAAETDQVLYCKIVRELLQSIVA